MAFVTFQLATRLAGMCGEGQELSSAADFFQPVHVAHLNEILPAIIPYLGLPAGWRFQVAPGHEDVWFDRALLDGG
jgi:hypothetical protein